ncbi:hypothetical protein BpHYR1_007430 [Brachionus plicatilis]|uniref:Uncharacterized protein n=1 Tax=Brachionus plicatilis TaxID=10195 RepID=A0A3M7SM02_BRAPC|nr:hypothetical protein BpHYR1_007430 [Brachionus plicatilis]
MVLFKSSGNFSFNFLRSSLSSTSDSINSGVAALRFKRGDIKVSGTKNNLELTSINIRMDCLLTKKS